MKNSDLPAIPIPFAVGASGDVYGGGEGECGLTKREHFAGLAMASLIGKSESRYDYGDTADDAVNFADALLAELDKEQGK